MENQFITFCWQNSHWIGFAANISLLLVWWFMLSEPSGPRHLIRSVAQKFGMQGSGNRKHPKTIEKFEQKARNALRPALGDHLWSFLSQALATSFMWLLSLLTTTTAIVLNARPSRLAEMDTYWPTAEKLILQTADTLTFNAFAILGNLQSNLEGSFSLKLLWFSFGAFTTLALGTFVGEFLNTLRFVNAFRKHPVELIVREKYPDRTLNVPKGVLPVTAPDKSEIVHSTHEKNSKFFQKSKVY